MDVTNCCLCGGRLDTSGPSISFCSECHAIYRFHPESKGNFTLTIFRVGNDECPANAATVARLCESIQSMVKQANNGDTKAYMAWANVPLVIEQIRLEM